MNDFYSIKLDKASSVPVYKQLGEGLCVLIEKGIIKPNTKLPPIRKMSDALKINNVTVINAYKYLESKKIVYSQIGSGTYVSQLFTNDIKKTEQIEEVLPQSFKNYINFTGNSPCTKLFPSEDFKFYSGRYLDLKKGAAFGYAENLGSLNLRKAIVEYVGEQGISTTTGNVVIIECIQKAIDIILKLLIKNSKNIFVEEPSGCWERGLFSVGSNEYNVYKVPLENDGLHIERLESMLEKKKPSLLYVMPVFHNPTGICYSAEKMNRLLYLAEKYDFYIIEEDGQIEICYNDNDYTTLKELDKNDRVIYIKSFYKVIMAGLNIGFIILPKKIMLKLRLLNISINAESSNYFQEVLSIYMKSHKFKRHIQCLKNIFEKRVDNLNELVDIYLKDYVLYFPPKGGLYFWFKFKDTTVHISEFAEKLLKKKVIISPICPFYYNDKKLPYFKIGISAISEENEIEKGIAAMKSVFNGKYELEYDF